MSTATTQTILVPHTPTEAEMDATAVAILTGVVEELSRYEADVAHWREQGLAPRNCVHGAYLWVDHDIPCGACELGDDPEELTVGQARQMARGIAEQIIQTHTRYLDAVRHAITTVRETGGGRKQIRRLVRIGAEHHLRELHRLSDQFCWLDEDGTHSAAHSAAHSATQDDTDLYDIHHCDDEER